MKMKFLLVYFLIISGHEFLFAQAPVISYPGTQTYTYGVPISPLLPTNTGGAIPATTYGLVTTFAGNGAQASTNGTGTGASFASPNGITTDNAGNFYVTEPVIGDVRKITPLGVVTKLAGGAGQLELDGTGAAAGFYEPLPIVFDGSGNLYVADLFGNTIRKVTTAGVVTTFAGSGAYGAANGTGTAASFSSPRGLAIDAAGNLYVADSGNQLIRKISPLGVVSTFAGNGTRGYADGLSGVASFSSPASIAIDAAGNLYIGDTGNYRIRKISTTGLVSTLAGSGVTGTNDGPGISASFNGIAGIVVDASGNLYVADNSKHIIRMVTSSGVVSTIAGTGSIVPVLTKQVDGVGTAAGFYTPVALTLDGNGNLYIVENGNNLVRKMVLTGYTINPALPAGLNFDSTTGIISGTPTTGSPTTTYTITGSNISGYSSTTINITVTGLGNTAQTITFPQPAPVTYGSTDFLPGASSNSGLTINYTSSDTTVATIVGGKIHIKKTGSTIITASQAGNTTYSAAAPVTKTLTVLPATLTITANNQSKVYGTANPTLTVNYSGFVNGDGITSLATLPLITSTATTSSLAGNYPITASGAIAVNYTFTYIAGTLTVVPASAPVITAISAGAAITGTTVTITGTNLFGATAVSFGGIAANSYTVVSSTSINAVVALGASGNVTVSTPSGTGTYSGFIFVPVPTVIAGGPINLLTGGSVVLTANPGTGYSYQWIKDGLDISGATGSSYTATQGGSYKVKISSGAVSQVSAALTVNVAFSLPANNFTVTNTSASCKGSTNGFIKIIAAQHLNYVANISLVNNGSLTVPPVYAFTDSVLINNLPAEAYTIRIDVSGQTNYSQYFTSVISEPKDLSVYTAAVHTNNQLTLSLSGSALYNININGKIITTSSSQLDITLAKGTNHIVISTDKACQGVIEKDITISDETLVYPNPFDNTLNLDIGNAIVKNIDIAIYGTNGKITYATKYANASGILQLYLSKLNSGMYLLKLSADSKDTIYKIIKK